MFTKEQDRAIANQNIEFDAMGELAKQYRRLTMTAVVEDDYPSVRHDYEGALRGFVSALRLNRAPWFNAPGLKAKNFDANIISALHAEVDAELSRAGKWPPMNSAHEGYGVIMEEVDELWDHVKTRQQFRDLAAMRAEAVQVAAMALRFAHDICNEENGRK